MHTKPWQLPPVMTRERANEILIAQRAGSDFFPAGVINAALIATGDLVVRRPIAAGEHRHAVVALRGEA